MNGDRLRGEIGQAFLVGFEGTAAREASSLLEDLRPAGLVLLPRNIVSAGQVAELTGGLQRRATELGLPPLLIAVDQEGGAIIRLTEDAGFTEPPSAMTVGGSEDPEAARELAAACARELRSVGINVNLAPVLDLAVDPANTVIGSRSYGREARAVGEIAAAVVDGLQSEGVLAVAKHFPGHGATGGDSHVGLPRLTSSLDDLQVRDLVPFQMAIAAGVAAVMTAHVMTELDPERPATLSRATLTATLRGALGFEGLILTDAIEMRALGEAGFEGPAAAVEALKAGADLLVYEGNRDMIRASADVVESAVRSGELQDAAFERLARRVEGARARIGHSLQGDRDDTSRAAHKRLALDVAGRGLRVVGGSLPEPGHGQPGVLDTPAGRAFAAASGWPVVADAPGIGTSLVAVLDGAESPGDMDRLAGLLGRARSPAVVVLHGWQPPAGLPPDVPVLLADDLPASLWGAIAQRLAGRGDAGAAPIAADGRRP